MAEGAESQKQRPRWRRFDTETHCHCGGEYRGSDHCSECYCEQYESGDCGHRVFAKSGAFAFVAEAAA